MKTFLKTIQTFRFLLLMSLLIPAQVLTQNLPVPVDTDDDLIADPFDPYTAGGSYLYTLTPSAINGIIEWEVSSSDVAILNNAGLKMELNGATFDHTTSGLINSPDGTAEIIHIIPDPTATPILNATGTPFELTISDNDNTRVLTLTIPVIRKPVSVVMVLDRSGSMKWELESNNEVMSPDRRWDKLDEGVSLFGSQLAAPGISLPDDEFGIVYFSSSTNVEPLGPINTILSGTPNGSTAMGEGLFQAEQMLTNTAQPDNRKVILLFTDGEQNSGRLVNPDGETLSDMTPINSGDIEIYPIAIYGPGGYVTILQEIAERNNDDGLALFTSGVAPDIPGSPLAFENLSDFLMISLNTILQDSSPQLIETKNGNLNSQGFAEITFTVNDKLSELYFNMVSSDTLSPNIEFLKDNKQIPWSQLSHGTRTRFYTIEFPPKTPNGETPLDLQNVSSGGEWTLRINGVKGQSYKIGAIGNDHRLNLKYDIESTHNIGDPIATTVTLDYLGNPITNPDTVLCTILKPGDDIGDLLARTNAEFGTSDNPDAGSTGLQKYFRLLESDPNFVNALTANENIIPLTNNGDGTYSGNFTNTDVTGVYQLIYFVKGNHPEIGTYIRSYFRSAAFSFETVDEEASEFATQLNDGGITLTYRPAFNIGGQTRYVGPAFGNSITVTGDGINLQGIIDNGDGSYNIELQGNPNSDISVRLLDKEIYKGAAASFGTSDNIFIKLIKWLQNTLGIPFWLACLLLIVLLILIIWIIKKIRN